MITIAYIVLSSSAGAAVALVIAFGKGAYLVDLLIGGLAAFFLRSEAVLALVVLQFAARRVPFVARSFSEGLACQGLIGPILLPDGYITVDTSAAKDKRPLVIDQHITSSKSRAALFAFEQARRARRITKTQGELRRIARSNAANSVTPQ